MSDQYLPMLACALNIDKVGKYAGYKMEVKLDGVRCIASRDATGKITMISRQGKEMHQKLPHLVSQLETIPGIWTIDGELGYCDTFITDGIGQARKAMPVGLDFNATMRVIGSSPPEAKGKQKRNINQGMSPIKYIVFDILHKGNYSLIATHQLERWRELGLLLKRSDDLYDIEQSTIMPGWDEAFYFQLVSVGGEGVMLKNPIAPYYPNKRRANTWYKVKASEEFDGVIIGYDKGQGKYEGAIGALVVRDSTGREVRVSGMTDSVRWSMTENFENYMHKHVEIKHFGRIGENKDGYRHPQFVRMRPDLD